MLPRMLSLWVSFETKVGRFMNETSNTNTLVCQMLTNQLTVQPTFDT